MRQRTPDLTLDLNQLSIDRPFSIAMYTFTRGYMQDGTTGMITMHSELIHVSEPWFLRSNSTCMIQSLPVHSQFVPRNNWPRYLDPIDPGFSRGSSEGEVGEDWGRRGHTVLGIYAILVGGLEHECSLFHSQSQLT